MSFARKSVVKLYNINSYFLSFDNLERREGDSESFEDVFDSSSGKTVPKKLKKAELHKQFRRGEKAFEANHVKSFAWDPTLLVVKGSVRASMKADSYSTTVFFNDNFSVRDATCSCARGVACHHIAALLICAHYNISVTDIECTWKAKKSEERNDGLSFDQLFPQKKKYCAVVEPSPDEVKVMCNNLFKCGRGGAGIAWILQPESLPDIDNENDDPQCPDIPSILDIIRKPEFIASKDKFGFLLTSAKISPTHIKLIAAATVGQGSNPSWTEARLFRFNGSRLGDIIHASVKNRKLCESLLKSLFERVKIRSAVVKNVKGGKYKNVGVNAAQWGTDHESEARDKFKEITGLEVEETGVWIHESGLWASSPDGLIGSSAVLEIKCPFQFRNAKSLKECLMNEEEFHKCAISKRFAIYYDEDIDKFCMWDDHNYYHQVQGELWCSYRDVCYFAVWIPSDMAIVEVERSDFWYETNVPRLLDKYAKDFLPRLMKVAEE